MTMGFGPMPLRGCLRNEVVREAEMTMRPIIMWAVVATFVIVAVVLEIVIGD